MPKLTLKQSRFIKHYLQSGNATESAAKAGYDQTRGSLGVQGFDNLKNPKIAKAIEQALLKTEVTPEWITYQIRQEATDRENKASDRLRALEDLAKITEITGFSSHSPNLNIGDISISFGEPGTPSNVALSDSSTVIEGTIID